MKKIDLMLKVLFAVFLANGALAQGPIAGGPDCAGALPITLGIGWEDPTPGTCADLWYSFVAPADGELEFNNCSYNGNTKRIYGGTCGAPTLLAEGIQTWTGPCNITTLVTGGDTYYIQVENNWDCNFTWDLTLTNPDCPDILSPASFASDWDEGTIGWFPGSSETSWIITYGPAGFDPETEGTTVIDDDGIPTYVITGLEELTCYDVYITSDCGGGETGFPVGPTTFCTPAVCPTPLGPNETDITNTESTLNWSAGSDETSWDLEWGAEGFVLGTGDMDGYGTPFTTYALDELDPATCYDWYVRAVCEEDFGDGPETVYSLWVGPNEWCTNPNCLNPSDGFMVSTTGLEATLAWTENNDPEAEQWNIQYGAPGFLLGTGTTITNVPTNPYTITGLSADTDYCFYVQSVCGEEDDEVSGWSGPYCFSTITFCEAPTVPLANPTSSTEATLDWTPGGTETEWEVSWGAGLTDPALGTMEDASVFPSLGLTGLTPGETYCYFVRAYCGESVDSASAWSAQKCWTQPALCETPFDLEGISMTNTAGFINYTAPGAESVEIEWGAPCFEPFADEEIGSAETSDDPYYMTGLEENTPYWVYVRATCGEDSISLTGGPVLIGTDITNDDPCDAEELVLDGPAVLRHNFDATTLPGETSLLPPASGCFETDGWCSGDGVDRTVWFKFTAPASGQVKLSTFNESECITNTYTEMAIYSTGDCSIFENYVLESANTLADDALEPPYGSEIVACGLTPGETYYVMVNPISYIQTEVHFGIELTSIEEVNAGLGLSPTICAGSTYDLFDAIAGFSDEDGQWYNPSVAPGNELPNLVSFPDGVGSYNLYYVVDNGCDADTVETIITTEEGVDAGGDGFYESCNTYPIILSDHISGSYDGGGIWEYTGSDPDVALAGGLFTVLGMTPGTYEFLYTVTSEVCPTDTAIVTITLFDCLSVDEESANALSVYPNPVVDVLTVQNVDIKGNAVIEVLDVEGRVVISNQVSNVFGNYTINMSNVESGIYFVKVTSEESVQKVRVVKQ